MAQEIKQYRCEKCGYMQTMDFNKCPACSYNKSYVYSTTTAPTKYVKQQV